MMVLLLRSRRDHSKNNNNIIAVYVLLSLLLLLCNSATSNAFVFLQPSKKTRASTTSRLRVATTLTPPPSQQLLEKESSSSSSSSQDDSTTDTDTTNIGVLLLNLGGPEKAEDVEGFLYNLFADPDIIRLPTLLSPLQSIIAYGISKRRTPKSREAYESIGGGSPILKYSNEQASLIKESIKNKYDLDVKTYVAMRYWHPFTEDVLREVQDDKINALVIIPLYPQFSISTSGSSLRLLQEIFAKNSNEWDNNPNKNFVHTVIPSWYNRRGYIKSISSLINKELNSFTQDEINEGLEASAGAGGSENKGDNNNKISRHVLFSAHGVPKSYIEEAGDPYQEQIKECVKLISNELPSEEDGVKIHLSYQSRVGPIEWLRPYTDDVLVDLGQNQNVKNLVVVPISFVSEHIETLEEIDIEYKELAQDNGIKNWKRCPALNTDPTFIDDMADMVYDALNEPLQTITETCISNNCFDAKENDDNMKNSLQEQEALIDSMTGFGAAGIGGSSSSSSSSLLLPSIENNESSSSTTNNNNINNLLIERISGRIALFGILFTILFELFKVR